METLMIILTGVFVTVATYLVLSRSLIRVIIGTSIFTHAVHILILTMGGLKTGGAPVLNEETAVYVDALPQALILTSIVINFGVSAIFLVIAYRTYQELGTDNLFELRGYKDE
jgi:multicomponent Na+:H+ antiporter subunit C